MDCWKTLGIAQTADKREIKRAYAKLIKQNNPEEHPEAFQRIREAYDHALEVAEYLAEADEDQEESDAAAPAPLPASIDVRDPESADELEGRLQSRRPSEKEARRAAQDEAVSKALERLIALLREDETAAIEFCRNTLQDSFFQALDVRHDFEGRLLLALLQTQIYSFKFVHYLAEEFRWDVDLYRRGYIVTNHFGAEQRFAHAFHLVVRPFVIDLAIQETRRHLQLNCRDATNDRIAELESLLFGETHEAKLASFYAQRKNKEALESACSFLGSHGFMDHPMQFVPSETRRWLRNRGVGIAANSPGQASQNSAQESSRFSWWPITVGVLILVRLLASLQTDSHSKYEPATNYSADSGSRSKSPLDVMTRLLIREVAELQRRADGGDAEAQYSLGMKYLTGSNRMLEKNVGQAVQWLQRAADQEHAQAREQLGILYYTGEGVAKDYAKAVELLTWAAEHNRGDAAYWLAKAYEEGNGVKRSVRESQRHLDRAVELGSAEGLRQKGLKLLHAQGKDRDVAKGAEYLKTAADKGNANATYVLAVEYLSGQNLPRDYAQGYRLLDTEPMRRYPIVEFWLAQLCEKGLGGPQDALRAKRLTTHAEKHATPETITEFAWQLASSPNKELRNSTLAVTLMEQLLGTPQNANSDQFETLAMAYSTTGRFPEAVKTQKQAIEKLAADAPGEQRKRLKAQLSFYEQGKTFIR